MNRSFCFWFMSSHAKLQKGLVSLPWSLCVRTNTIQPSRRLSGWTVNGKVSPGHNPWQSPCCALSLHGCRPVSTKAEKHEDSGLLLNDPKKGKLVYYGPFGSRVRGLKILSISSSMTCMSLFPFLVMRAEKLPPFFQGLCGLVAGFFIFLQPVIIHWLVYRYVIALYYDRQTKTFTATTMTFIGTKKDMKFTKNDIEKIEVPTLFERVRVKGRPLYMENDFFLDIDAFRIIMNYDNSDKYR